MIDTVGPVRLTVNDTNHLIRRNRVDAKTRSISTDVVTRNGTVQRGISVNTDPWRQRIVLATIGTLMIRHRRYGDRRVASGPPWATRRRTIWGHRVVLPPAAEPDGSSGNWRASVFAEDGARPSRTRSIAGTVPGQARPTLSVARTATGLSITFTGTLHRRIPRPNLTDVAGATSPPQSPGSTGPTLPA
jgi:hypothetical protein